ncbi:hypothetical protein SLEP1_g26875 [Rubroshorea leprosula]|uniref:LETM1-like protein n=2 Tax=Rubroshorea leprosula TaxID=152421 RepID=A0AAV5JZ92_9ROSI|nr:hypothetical protein SLEP1_g26875 [Rubroshorea leprosula]
MASHLSLHRPHLSHYPRRVKSNAVADSSKFNGREQGSCFLSKKSISFKILFGRYISSRCMSSGALSSMSSSPFDETESGDGALLVEADDHEEEFNRVNCLVWVLHESARSFSLAVQSLGLAGSQTEVAMAWNGKDVHEWHKRIAYQVAVYALLKMAIEVEILLSQERYNNPSPVRDILTPKINLLEDYIESQLNARHPQLIQWFRMVELPCIAGFFSPLLKKWSMEYAGSGVAGIIVAISCCAAVAKLGSGRTSYPFYKLSIEDTLVELMDLSYSIVSVDKLHQLATEAGFERDFLSHFGTNVLSGKKNDELEFWIGLAQKKLSLAFQKETVIPGKQAFHKKVQADSLATLGLFAYLGRKTRLFLSKLRINDLDELVKDFLSYLECGSLFIYPEFSSISVYQFFMEVVTDEIGWFDFYGVYPSMYDQVKRRSKHHTIQAEKEIILSTVFTVCYDVFSGFAHFSRSTQQPLDSELLAFLLRSQSLLTICLEDYWAAYDRSGDLLKIAELASPGQTTGAKATIQFSVKPAELMIPENLKNKSTTGSLCKKDATDAINFVEGTHMSKSIFPFGSVIRKYSIKLISTSSDIWMGTQLLFIDVMFSLELLLKQLHGNKITARERKKLKTTLNDIATLIPITILMLLPVSAIGHAAMLAAIKKYVPSLIPSPYSSERLDAVKQLNRTKKMEVAARSNLEDPPQEYCKPRHPSC